MNSESVAILIVDDEPPLLRLMQAFLERLGYSITGCPDATTAMLRFSENPDHYSLLIADLSLPDMPGDAMALKMLDMSAKLRVLLCSGYPFDLATLPPAKRAFFGVLQKPFLPNMLAKSVEDLLKSSA